MKSSMITMIKNTDPGNKNKWYVSIDFVVLLLIILVLTCQYRTRLSAGYKTKERHTDLFLLFLDTAGIRFFQKRVICDNSSPATDRVIQGGVHRHPAIV